MMDDYILLPPDDKSIASNILRKACKREDIGELLLIKENQTRTQEGYFGINDKFIHGHNYEIEKYVVVLRDREGDKIMYEKAFRLPYVKHLSVLSGTSTDDAIKSGLDYIEKEHTSCGLEIDLKEELETVNSAFKNVDFQTNDMTRKTVIDKITRSIDEKRKVAIQKLNEGIFQTAQQDFDSLFKLINEKPKNQMSEVMARVISQQEVPHQYGSTRPKPINS
jgi:hypothetical protein